MLMENLSLLFILGIRYYSRLVTKLIQASIEKYLLWKRIDDANQDIRNSSLAKFTF